MSEHDGWFYLPFGVMTHFRGTDATGVLLPEAVCEIGHGEPKEWHGTGSQDEYDKVAILARCRKCVTLLGGGAR